MLQKKTFRQAFENLAEAAEMDQEEEEDLDIQIPIVKERAPSTTSHREQELQKSPQQYPYSINMLKIKRVQTAFAHSNRPMTGFSNAQPDINITNAT